MTDEIEKIMEMQQLTDGLKDDLSELELPAKIKEMIVLDTPKKELVVVDPDQKKDIDEDYGYARNTFQYLVGQGNEALVGLLEMIKDNPSPRSFEVLSGLINSITATTEKMMKLQQEYNDIKKDPKKTSTTQNADTINNIQFVGTADDLIGILEQDKNKNNGEVS